MRPLLPLLALAAPAVAQTAHPMITHCTPVAVQRGTATAVTVDCQTPIAGAYRVLFTGTGVTATCEPDGKNPKQAVLKIAAAADAPLGARDFRVAAAAGISTLGQLLVVDAPVVVETAPTNSAAKAQKLPIPGVGSGRIAALEDVDFYTFSAKKGVPLTFEVFGARIEDKIHDLQKHLDPLIAVFDAAGKELAANDDAAFADPILRFDPPADGVYTLTVRDAKYDGDPRWAYAVLATDKPYAAAAYPFGLHAGAKLKVEAVLPGGVRGPDWILQVPKDAGVHAVTPPGGNPVAVVAAPFPTYLETEPNDDPSRANPISVPGGNNGRIGAKRDVDCFKFPARKGTPVELTVYARRFGTPLNSPLDAVLEVIAADGKVLASNDDANGKDPALVFTPPADGAYVARIKDLNSKGGEAFVYYLEAKPAAPDFDLKVDPGKAILGPGGHAAWYVTVARRNGFVGPVPVTVEGLPAGVTVSALTIPPNMTQGVLVFSAAKDAKPDATGVVVKSGEKRAAVVEEIYLPGGGRGRFDVGLAAVSVTGPTDLTSVTVDKARVTLKPGEEVTLNVTVARRTDYDKPVTLDVLLRHGNQVFATPLPPGVTMLEGKSKTLLGKGNTGTVVLKAAADAAPCTDVPLCVNAFVPVNFVVKIGYASQVILLSVAK